MGRVILAGILGGAIVFFCGFVEHAVFKWGQPTAPPDEQGLIDPVKSLSLPPGVYYFPRMGADVPEAEREKANERYRQGPSGLLVIGRTGEEPLSFKRLGLEGLSNIAAAFIAAWILAQLMPGTGFFQRWRIVLLVGVFAWLSVDASYGIWYAFSWSLIRDQLFCALFEWGVAGLAIAAIVKPAPAEVP
jgi:hypothetical protein